MHASAVSCVCMYGCLYVCMDLQYPVYRICICMNVCICTILCMYVCRVCIRNYVLCMLLYIYTCIYLHYLMYVYVCNVYTCMCVCMQCVYMYVCMYVCIPKNYINNSLSAHTYVCVLHNNANTKYVCNYYTFMNVTASVCLYLHIINIWEHIYTGINTVILYIIIRAEGPVYKCNATISKL